MSTPPKQRLTIDQRLQRSREEGYLAGRAEMQAAFLRQEAELLTQRSLLTEAMAALEKEREAHEPIDLWPSKPMAVNGGFYHQWPGPIEHLWSEWQQNTGRPKFTQYRKCLHPKCIAVQHRDVK